MTLLALVIAWRESRPRSPYEHQEPTPPTQHRKTRQGVNFQPVKGGQYWAGVDTESRARWVKAQDVNCVPWSE